ncbi:4Fe-4S dicluster domain-containing protein [Paraglaciecola arctica]|uniref:Polyhedral body protein n=1 Tax=Paraglaciecola arctica BSs20135 TaxID=493475 RepID=K6ZFS5_9ALTE|nr:4Fe-4S dicluster domain-containing protein [Paraglaciecola arctica]GAC22260.1 polyhedral body protein [Paraglaciecola arctica BSs20135]
MSSLVDKVRQAGVVGAGGAGFPCYVKIASKADILIANGAECEPLLNKDQMVMQHFTEQMLQGMQLLMQQVGASRGVLAFKQKHQTSIAHVQPLLPDNIELKIMPNVYPAGDEYELVYEVTGQRIPAGGLPKDVGVLVHNVETIFNIYQAAQDKPMTHTMLTVHGEVQRPFTAWLPIGMSYADVLKLAGDISCETPVIVEGGVMMGTIEDDFSTSISATTSGLLVLPHDAHVVTKKSESESTSKRIGKAACDQCTLCTEMCPRYLLGYPIQPHLVMRSLLTTGVTSETLSLHAQACSECNICTLWACPEQLNPRDVCVATKRDLKEKSLWQTTQQLQAQTRPVHNMREYRGVPTSRLIRRLGLAKYDKRQALWLDEYQSPSRVAISLQTHMGARAEPIVKEGDEVTAGDVIAIPPIDAMGVPVHASITGRVTFVGEHIDILLKENNNGQ